MPKPKLTWRMKIKTIYTWLRMHNEYGLICSCGQCKSTRINRHEFTEKENADVKPAELAENYKGNEYTATYICMDCGAVGYGSELWLIKKGDSND